MTTYVIANASDAHEAAEAVGMGVETHGWDMYWNTDGFLDTQAIEHDEWLLEMAAEEGTLMAEWTL
jgi:hypothetical protein